MTESALSARVFMLPALVVSLLVAGLFNVPYALVAAIVLGLGKITIDSWERISEGQYSLDYVALTAMIVALVSGEYLAGAVIALMFVGGEALEAFASDRAESSLRALAARIPKTCLVKIESVYEEVPIQNVTSGTVILLKPHELVPLDGRLVSTGAILDVANLTGESDPLELVHGAFIKSGSVNIGQAIELEVVGDFSTSTYHKIVGLVEEARRNPTRFVRVAEQVNIPFTIAAFAFSIGAYLFTGEISRALAVLVIATPCPLIIAAPVAFICGLSRAARNSIIVRTPTVLESISRITSVFFDKTGTLTIGEPRLEKVTVLDTNVVQDENDALAIAASIELHSLHPLARALVNEARRREVPIEAARNITEKIGEGISGEIRGARYAIKRAAHGTEAGIELSLLSEGKEIVHYHFVDVLKEDVDELFDSMRSQGLELAMITGDRKENAETLFGNHGIRIYADASPEDKYKIIESARGEGKVAMMVGDGLNDAPALARADVGVVFSGAENAASIEAARIVILDHRLKRIRDLLDVSRKSMRVARESVYGGIALSLVGMTFAAFGYIAPVQGALIQEAIDVIVILNALRALR